MGVLVSTAGITAASTFIAEREIRRRLEQQVIQGFGLAGEFIPLAFAALDIGRRGTGPQLLLRDLITMGELAPQKIRRLEELKPIDQRRLVVRLQEWAQEIIAPGTGQPVIATFGILPEERGQLRPVVSGARQFFTGAPTTLADGTPLLELRAAGGRLGGFSRAPLAPFRRTAAELRRLAERRGLL